MIACVGAYQALDDVRKPLWDPKAGSRSSTDQFGELVQLGNIVFA